MSFLFATKYMQVEKESPIIMYCACSVFHSVAEGAVERHEM